MWRDIRDFLIFWWTFDAAVFVGAIIGAKGEGALDGAGWFALALFGLQPAALALILIGCAIVHRMKAAP